jgi:hypothetical protein
MQVVSEFAQGMMGTAGLLLTAIYATLSWFGGRSKNYLGVRARIWGRIIAPLFFCLGAVGLAIWSGAYSHFMLLSIPAYLGASTMGWGDEGRGGWFQLYRITLWSLVRTSCSLTFAIPTGMYGIFVLQVISGLMIAAYMQVENPVVAPQEETAKNYFNVALVPFMII